MIHVELLFTIILSHHLSDVQFIGSSTGSAGFFILESFHKTRSDLQNTRHQSVQRQQIPPVSSHAALWPGPGRADSASTVRGLGWAGPRTAQAIRLFQGYALIMEWAAYRDSRKADWEQIGRGKTSPAL